MLMPIGKHKGQPVESMATQYLAWLCTRDDIRFKHWPLIKEALRVLRSRDLDTMLAELKVDKPIDYRPTPEQIAQRAARKAEKLRALEERREQEHLQQQAERSQVIDAGVFLRQERARALQAELAKRQPCTADPNDVSDLL